MAIAGMDAMTIAGMDAVTTVGMIIAETRTMAVATIATTVPGVETSVWRRAAEAATTRTAEFA